MNDNTTSSLYAIRENICVWDLKYEMWAPLSKIYQVNVVVADNLLLRAAISIVVYQPVARITNLRSIEIICLWIISPHLLSVLESNGCKYKYKKNTIIWDHGVLT